MGEAQHKDHFDPSAPSRESAPRVAIVTGGAGGLGFACAQQLATTGSQIAIVDVAGATDAARGLGSGGRHVGIVADVTQRQDVETAVTTVLVELGPPSILVNAAGVLRPTRVLDITDEEWNTVVGTSLTGTFLFSQVCARLMVEERYGRIVNFSSTAGKSVSTLGGAHYTAGKAGVLGLTRAFAKELAPFGITVNAVCPGLIDTQMAHAVCTQEQLQEFADGFPIPRLGRPAEVAAAVEFLCGEQAAYITGAAIDINGGDLMV